MSILNKRIGGSLNKKLSFIAIFLFAIVISILIGYKFIVHELNQKEHISILYQRINSLSARIEKIENADKRLIGLIRNLIILQ